MTVSDLTIACAVGQNQLAHFLTGFGDEIADRPPPGGGNPVRWIVGHILAERVELVGVVALTLTRTRRTTPEIESPHTEPAAGASEGGSEDDRILALLDDPEPGAPGGAYFRAGLALQPSLPDVSMFVTGTQPDPAAGPSFTAMRNLLEPSHQAVHAALQGLTDTDLALPQPGTMLGEPLTLGRQLLAYPLHQMYHIGQISSARRVLGLGSAGG